MKLSILIPTIEGREAAYNSLYNELLRQTLKYGPDIEIISAKDNKEVPLGKKRNMLYNQANGDYSWQIDDDDWIDCEAIGLIMEAIEKKPDCVTFEEYCRINGEEYRSNHSIIYDDWADNMDGYDYIRTPFYKDVLRTDICVAHSIPELRYGEDHAQSRILKPILKTEVHIPHQIYHYIHFSYPEQHETRYGFNYDKAGNY